MEFLSVCDESLRRAAAVISGGGLVAFPTETVYGLGGDAFNPAALAKIFEAKGRPRFDPLIVHIAALETLEKMADLSTLADDGREKLAVMSRRLWPGPLTLILPKLKAVPDLATSGLATVAVRFPDHPVAQRLISLSTGAIAAPSANPFGYLSPTRAEHVRDQLGANVDIILDGGPCSVGVESTVLDICGAQPRILRPGGTPKEAIEALIGPVLSDGEIPGGSPVSPGQLKSHYAPRTPLLVYATEDIIALPGEKGEAFLFVDGASRETWLAAQQGNVAEAETNRITVRVLSETGDLLEAAARLFEMLHELDRPAISRIRAQLAPEQGLGAAINDRLRRASCAAR